jgi:hypothetical protein
MNHGTTRLRIDDFSIGLIGKGAKLDQMTPEMLLPISHYSKLVEYSIGS